MRRNFLTAFSLGGFLIVVAEVANGQSPFYQGKTITVIAGTEPGGDHSAHAGHRWGGGVWEEEWW